MRRSGFVATVNWVIESRTGHEAEHRPVRLCCEAFTEAVTTGLFNSEDFDNVSFVLVNESLRLIVDAKTRKKERKKVHELTKVSLHRTFPALDIVLLYARV